MCTLHITGTTAEWLWQNVHNALGFLAGCDLLPHLPFEERRELELPLLGALMATMYGTRDERFNALFGWDYLAYIKSLESPAGTRRDYMRLYSGNHPLTLHINADYLNSDFKIIDYGYAEGVTIAIPLTPDGVTAFHAGKFDTIEVCRHPEYTYPIWTSNLRAIKPLHLYIGTFFHLGGIRHLSKAPGDVTLSGTCPQATLPLYKQLFSHVSHFMPHLTMTQEGLLGIVEGRKIEYRPEHLPKLYAGAATAIGAHLLAKAGFQNLDGDAIYPRFVLDLGDLNRKQFADVTFAEAKRLTLLKAKVKALIESDAWAAGQSDQTTGGNSR